MWSALAHGQGKLFLLAPECPGLSGMDIAQPGSLFSRHRDSGGRANVLQGISLATGENRLMALQTLSPPQLRMSEPLVGASSRSLVAINAPWRQDAWVAALFYPLLVVGTVVPQGLRQRRRRAQFATSFTLEAQLSAERDHLAILVEALQVGVWERDLLTGEGSYLYLSVTVSVWLIGRFRFGCQFSGILGLDLTFQLNRKAHTDCFQYRQQGLECRVACG